jgi:hypothetical protein
MIKYSLAALALKFFSLNRLTKKAYRKIGNTFGAKKRIQGGIDSYIAQGDLLLDLCEKYRAVGENGRLLEIGTGWMHWYSLYLRLFYDNVGITMMDVWDNRQFEALKASFLKLKEISPPPPRRRSAPAALDRILNASGFDELYERFDLNYVIDEQGTLERFPTATFDLVFSFHVLEHIEKAETREVVGNIHRILKPGGFSIHQIGIDDHLSHYDRRASPMNYLRYSDAAWKIFFQNEVQYFNRLLMRDWLELFERGGFVLLEKIAGHADIDSLPIHPKYRHYDPEDLSCANLTIVHWKPK